MCGITAFFARESKPDYKVLDTLFSGAERRGQDGFGFVIIRNEKGGRHIRTVWKDARMYSDCKDDVKNIFMANPLNIGDVVIAIARAAPESEGNTNKDKLLETMQPIVNKEQGLVLVHNGAVSQKIYNELKEWANNSGEYKFNTKIDSEAILASYIMHGRNMKECFEYLSGGFAVLLYSQSSDRLFMINDFKPLSWGYIRGVGLFIHSLLDPIADIVHDISGVERCGIAIWEDFYYHQINGPRVQSIDLTSGFCRKQKYSPRYITQNWDSNNGIIKKN